MWLLEVLAAVGGVGCVGFGGEVSASAVFGAEALGASGAWIGQMGVKGGVHAVYLGRRRIYIVVNPQIRLILDVKGVE